MGFPLPGTAPLGIVGLQIPGVLIILVAVLQLLLQVLIKDLALYIDAGLVVKQILLLHGDGDHRQGGAGGLAALRNALDVLFHGADEIGVGGHIAPAAVRILHGGLDHGAFVHILIRRLGEGVYIVLDAAVPLAVGGVKENGVHSADPVGHVAAVFDQNGIGVWDSSLPGIGAVVRIVDGTVTGERQLKCFFIHTAACGKCERFGSLRDGFCRHICRTARQQRQQQNQRNHRAQLHTIPPDHQQISLAKLSPGVS